VIVIRDRKKKLRPREIQGVLYCPSTVSNSSKLLPSDLVQTKRSAYAAYAVAGSEKPDTSDFFYYAEHTLAC
jgi:hypothetical protein